jgi:hypothetical protein
MNDVNYYLLNKNVMEATQKKNEYKNRVDMTTKRSYYKKKEKKVP